MKNRALILLFFTLGLSLYAQNLSVEKHIRFPLWANVDAYPELQDFAQTADSTEEEYSYPINQIKQISEFILNGMVFGWEFKYTPSDKARKIEEVFEITELRQYENVKDKIVYSSPWIEDNKFNCWVEYDRSPVQIQNYNLWSSIQNATMQGRGYGPIQEGFEGIRKACEDALKNAVRSYYREIIKNKPREIRGSVLIRKAPLLGIDSGRYVINLDFFLEYGKIIEYKQF